MFGKKKKKKKKDGKKKWSVVEMAHISLIIIIEWLTILSVIIKTAQADAAIFMETVHNGIRTESINIPIATITMLQNQLMSQLQFLDQ